MVFYLYLIAEEVLTHHCFNRTPTVQEPCRPREPSGHPLREDVQDVVEDGKGHVGPRTDRGVESEIQTFTSLPKIEQENHWSPSESDGQDSLPYLSRPDGRPPTSLLRKRHPGSVLPSPLSGPRRSRGSAVPVRTVRYTSDHVPSLQGPPVIHSHRKTDQIN